MAFSSLEMARPTVMAKGIFTLLGHAGLPSFTFKALMLPNTSPTNTRPLLSSTGLAVMGPEEPHCHACTPAHPTHTPRCELKFSLHLTSGSAYMLSAQRLDEPGSGCERWVLLVCAASPPYCCHGATVTWIALSSAGRQHKSTAVTACTMRAPSAKGNGPSQLQW